MKAIKSFGIINFCIIIVGVILVSVLAYHMPISIENVLTKNTRDVSYKEFEQITLLATSMSIIIFGFFNGTMSFFRKYS